MNSEVRGLLARLGREVIPTTTQTLGAIFLGLGVLVVIQSQDILARFGISDDAIMSTRHQLSDRFNVILQSDIASSVALVSFWAAVGLVAYLVCWGGYNIFVEARNEAIIETQYTNHPLHWRGPLQTLGLKMLFGLLLLLYCMNFQYALAFWLAMTAPILDHFGIGSVVLALGGVLGLALQLYGLLLLLQLTLTPWYRSEAFTDVKN
jgi:hypothetical protein